MSDKPKPEVGSLEVFVDEEGREVVFEIVSVSEEGLVVRAVTKPLPVEAV